MIISHKYKFIFIAVPKTATHAIRFAVRPLLGEEDIEQVELFVEKRSSFNRLAGIGHGHVTCREMRSELDKKVWNTYFKFAIVRNPYDRFISYCSFMQRENDDFKKNPQPYLYHALLNKRIQKHILFHPQSHFLVDEKGETLTDYIGKYEALQESYDHICSRTGMPSVELRKINVSNHLDYQAYYNDEIRSLVTNFYKSDIELFNYKFQPE